MSSPYGPPFHRPPQSFVPPPPVPAAWPVPGVWTCPFCRFQGAPLVERKVSNAGWVVFIVLFFVTCVLCWIGLLMKEEVRRCPACRTVVG